MGTFEFPWYSALSPFQFLVEFESFLEPSSKGISSHLQPQSLAFTI
jgi:hypothetical protein